MKLPRDVSGADAVEALHRLGFERNRRTGSQIRLSKGGKHVAVPQHPNLAPKTLLSILRQAGVSLDDFHSAL